MPAPPAPTLRGKELEINTIPSGESATLSNESQTTADLVLTSEELGNGKLVMMLNRANGSDGKRQRAQVHDMSMPPPEARPCNVTTDTSAASQEPQKLAGLSSTLSKPDGPGNEKLSSNLGSPDGQDSTSSNATLLDNAYGGDCVCDPRAHYVCAPCTDNAEEALLNKPSPIPMVSGNTVVQKSVRQQLIPSGVNIMDPSQVRTPRQPRSMDCTSCGKSTTYYCTGISATDRGCFRGPCCQPNPECDFCWVSAEAMFPTCAPGSELTLVELPKERCARCVANGDPTGEYIADYYKCRGGNSQCEMRCGCKDARDSGLQVCNGCSVKFCSVHARAKRNGDPPRDISGHTCHGKHLATQANIVAHLGCNANAITTPRPTWPMDDRERDGPCSECLIPQDSRTPCILCDQLLCEKCLPQGMHGECIVVQLGGNANEVVISPNMADRERSGPCSECLIPQDTLTPCLYCDQLLCEKCLPQELHGYCADTLLPLENKRTAMPTVRQVTPNMKCLADVAMTSPNAIPSKATLLDNGASVHCFKTLSGALLHTYEPEVAGDGISVGDENAALESQGSYTYAMEYSDAHDQKVQILVKALHCPDVICDIMSESKLVYEEHCTITFNGTAGRVITLLNGKQMSLTMTPNGLGWLKSRPITDEKTVLELLNANEKKAMVVSIPRISPSGSVLHDRLSDAQMRAIARTNGVSEEGLDSYVHAWALSISAQGDAAGTAIETDGMEPNPNQVDTSTPVVPSDILVDDLASSDNMYHLIDPMLNKCTAEQPIAVNTAIVASTGVQVVPASIDPNLNHFDYYNQLLSSDCGNVSASAALACARAYVNFVSVNATSKGDAREACDHLASCEQSVLAMLKGIPAHILELFAAEPPVPNGTPLLPMCATTEECAERIAYLHLSVQRAGTRYAIPSDETSACNAEPRINELVQQMRQLACDGELHVLRAYNKEVAKHNYTDKNLLDMKMQQNIIAASRHCKRAHFNPNQVTPLYVDNVSATKLLLAATGPTKPLSAPPLGIGFGRPPPLTGLEILRRIHCALGHCSLDQLLETLAKAQNMRAGVITRADVEAFRKEGCGLCTIWLMRQSPVKSLTDPVRAPVGKKWSYDTMHLKVASPEGYMYITRYYDEGSHLKKSYGHVGMDTQTFEKLMGQLRAFVRPHHGEIWIGKRDGLPALGSREMRDCLAENQIIDQVTAPYRHQSMPVENTWSHDVPRTMAMLQQGPGAKQLRHFFAAFLCQERASNRTVKPRQHKEPLSAEMLFYGNDHSQINLLFIFFAPVFYLVHPEVRNSKFHEHAKPAVYYGPSRDTDSERYCLLWNGQRTFTCDIGCMRIDESQLLARMSKTSAALQPWTLEPDEEPPMPNFDQWTTPSLTNTTGGQNEPEIVMQEMDPDIVPGDPDPTTPFVVFVGAGKRRIGEVGHWVKRITSGAVRVVSIDPKRRGYSHNVLIPRVREWVAHLCALVLCIAIIMSIPCSPWAPQKLNAVNGGPKVLFNALNPDGIILPSGHLDPMATGALQLAEVCFDMARKVDAHGGKVIVETPVNHGKHSMWPIKGREEHSTLFDTTLFKTFAKDVPGDIVYSDQCMTGADTRKTTQWYCNLRALPKAIKFIGELICPGLEGGHDHSATSLVGKRDNGKWRSEGSDEYTPNLSGRLAHIVLEDEDEGVTTPTTKDVDAAGGGGEDTPTIHTPPGDDDADDDSDPDDPNLPDAPFEALKETLISNQEAATARRGSQLDSPQQESPTIWVSTMKQPEDPYPVGTNVDVYWTGDKTWFSGTVIDSHVTKKRTDNNAGIRNIQVRYPDGDFTHTLHNNQVRKSAPKAHDLNTPQLADGALSSAAATTSSASPVLPATTSSASPVLPEGEAAAAPDAGLLSWLPSAYRNAAPEKSPSFVHQGEKVVALPEEAPASPDLGGYEPFVATCPRFHQKIKHWSKTLHADWLRDMTMQQATDLIAKSKANDEIGKGNKGYDETVGSRGLSVMPYVEQYVHELSNTAQVCDQATMGDLGTQQVVNSMISNTKQNMLRTGCSERYTQCMESMESAIAHNSDPFSVVSYLYDFEDDVMFTRNVITAIINGVEMVIDPNEPENWHTPKNEREYLRSPQRAQWRTAREKKMDQYMDLKVFKLVNRAGIDPKRIMGSLWANKIKFDEKGKFCSLNPRWCVKGFGMDKSIYTGFSEVCLTTTIKIMACIRASYRVSDFLFDASNAFQATRTDDGTVSSEKLFCHQAPGFSVKDTDGTPMVCEILVALQGRVDAARLFGQRLEQILFKLGARRSTWDPKAYFFHFGPLTDTAATLDEVLAACAKVEKGNDKHGRPNGWAVLAVHVDDCPGIASSDRMINYIKAGIETQYKVTHAPWKKVLGFKFECTETTVTMSAEHSIEMMYKTFLQGQLKYDARMPGRDVKLSNGEAPAAGDPRLTAYLEMQSETRSLLGLLLWVSLAYPQICYQVNRACGFMSNPSHEVNAYAKHIAMHLYQYPTPVTWGGASNLELSQPTVPPFTDGAKEYGLHFAADASPDDAARGITGGVGMLNGGTILNVSSRQHLATPDMHANEVLAAGTIMHKVVPLRGFLTEARIPQEHGTPLYIDSASTVFVAQSRGAVKKSAWIRRRSEVLTEAFDMGECDPKKIEEFNNFSDPQTKYLVYRVWARHLHYTHNLPGDPPPPVEKPTKKGPSASGVLVNMTKKSLLLAVGL